MKNYTFGFIINGKRISFSTYALTNESATNKFSNYLKSKNLPDVGKFSLVIKPVTI